jgi:hypothetical protein
MTDCPHHKDNCPILICERVPYPCYEVAQWYVEFGGRAKMPRCNEHVPKAMSWSAPNTVTRVPRELRGG